MGVGEMSDIMDFRCIILSTILPEKGNRMDPGGKSQRESKTDLVEDFVHTV
jgi:hypothetical protein